MLCDMGFRWEGPHMHDEVINEQGVSQAQHQVHSVHCAQAILQPHLNFDKGQP